jgi:hypothetical protein
MKLPCQHFYWIDQNDFSEMRDEKKQQQANPFHRMYSRNNGRHYIDIARFNPRHGKPGPITLGQSRVVNHPSRPTNQCEPATG